MKRLIHTQKFAEMLTKAVHKIRLEERKTVSIVQDELGYALGKSGGSMIEHWRKGKSTPSHREDVEILAEELVKRGNYDRPWLKVLLKYCDYVYADELCDKLFPPVETAAEPVAELPLEKTEKTEKTEKRSTEPTVSPSSTVVELPEKQLPSPAPLPAGSVMPFGRNPLFVGREADLLELASKLKFDETKTMAISQMDTAAATGLGGMGKTQLACEFVHRFGQFFVGGVYWVSFDNPEAIPAEIAACGGAGNLNFGSDFKQRSLKEQTEMVMSAWRLPVPRLLIFDNCEDPELVMKWRPKYGGCRILLTSRRGNWDKVLGVNMLALGTLARDESINLLSENSGLNDQIIADEIAEELGDLPLALHLAGHYLSKHPRSVNPESYLKQLKDPSLLHHPSLQKGGVSPTGHAQSVWRTFAMSYELLDIGQAADQLARRLLVHVAHFAPGEPIWYELLVQTLELELEHETEAEGALNRLIDVGLIETEENTTLRMHRLVAQFVRDIAADDYQSAQQVVEEAVFAYTLEMNKAVQPLPLLAKQLHLRSVADLAQTREDGESAKLCNELGKHLWQISDFKGAEAYVDRGLEIRLKIFGEQHAETAESLVMLGRLMRSTSKIEKARLYFERSYNVRNELFGQDHLETAESLENIGRSCGELGALDQAYDYTLQALEVVKRVKGAETAIAAEYHNNLAHYLFRLGNIDDCLNHFKFAVTINTNVLGEKHPFTGLNLHNLGWVLKNIGQLDHALSYIDQALEIWESVYGVQHQIDRINSLDIKAQILLAQDRLQEAEPLVKNVVEGLETLLGEAHIRTTFGYLTKSQMLFKYGKYAEAERIATSIVDGLLDSLGEKHHLTQEALKITQQMTA